MEIIKSYTLYFNTREANVGTSNNCTFIFTTPIVLTNTNNRFLISTPMIELPYSFSQVNDTNQNLPYTYVDTNGAGHSFASTTMNIPAGNYNINQLLTQLVTSLIADIGSRPGAPLTTTNFSFLYNAQTGKVSYLMIPPGSYNITITFDFATSYVLGLMLGFPQAAASISAVTTIMSPNKIQVNPITSVYIRSDTLKFQSNYEAIVQTYQNSDILAKIPITTLPNSIIYYRNDSKSLITNKFISEFNLYVSDNLSTLYQLNMQGVNYGITIILDEVQIQPFNSYQDQLTSGKTSIPKQLIEKRDELLSDLIKRKQDLEEEINSRKQINKEDTQQELHKNDEI